MEQKPKTNPAIVVAITAFTLAVAFVLVGIWWHAIDSWSQKASNAGAATVGVLIAVGLVAAISADMWED